MQRVSTCKKTGLSLWLVVQLCLPTGLLAAPGDLARVEQLQEQSTLWVLSVGIAEYADMRLNLTHADRDAAKIAQAFGVQEGRLFRQVQKRVLVNAQATRAEILRALSQFLGQAGAADIVLIFFAGHGAQDRQSGTYYFVPHDANADNLYYAGLGMPMLAQTCRHLQAAVEQVVLLFDTGRPSADRAAGRSLNAGKDLATVLPRDAGLSWVSAHKPGEAAQTNGTYKFAGKKHGAFSTSLLRGLQGAAADDRGIVWLGNLLTYISQEVPQLTNSRQHPHGQLDSRDLPLFRTDASVDRLLGQSVSIATYGQRENLQENKEQGGSGLTLLWLLLVGAAAAGGALLTGSSDNSGGDPTAPEPSIIPPPPSLPDE